MYVKRSQPKASDTGLVKTEWRGTDTLGQMFCLGMAAGMARNHSIDLMNDARRNKSSPALCALLIKMARSYRRSYREHVKEAHRFDASLQAAARLHASVGSDRARSN